MELLTADEYSLAKLEWASLTADGADPSRVLSTERLVAFWTTHGLNDLYFFVKFILGYDKLSLNLHREMCRFAERTLPLRRGFVVPRGHFKSSVITIGKTLWDLMRNPEERILIVHERGDQARQFLAQIRSHIESNRFLNQLYPERIPPWKSKGWRWTADAINIRRPREWPEPSVFAAGWSSAFQGMHFTTLRFDDLIGEEAAANPDIMEKVVDWVRRSNPLFVNPRDGILDMIGTRWAYRDVYSWAIENYSEMAWFVRSAIVQGRDADTGEVIEVPLFPEEFSLSLLRKLEKEMGIFSFSCLPGEAPVMMADWVEKPIRDIRPGDRVIGYEHGDYLHLVEATVTNVGSHEKEVFEYRLSDGEVIRCTEDHNWFTGRNGSDHHKMYLPLRVDTDRRKVGTSVTRRLYTPSALKIPEGLMRKSAWLGGFFDGEGTIHGNKHVGFSQSESHNPLVCSKLRGVLQDLGFKWGEHGRDTISEISGKPGHTRLFWIQGGMPERLRFLKWCQPYKSDKLIGSLWDSKFSSKPIVLSKKLVGVQTVHAIETTSNNYIAYGLASKNSQYLNSPVTGTTQEFNQSWLRYYTKAETLIEGKRTAVVQQLPGDIRSSDETERVPLPTLAIYMHVDPGLGLIEGRIKAEAKHSHSAIQVVGVAHPRRIFILHAWKRVVSVPELNDQILRFYLAYEHYVSKITIESHSWTHMVRPSLLGMARDRGIALSDGRVEPYTKSANTKKEGRIRKLQPYFSNGQVFIEEDMTALVREYLDFPQAPPWDLLDALAQGPDYWVFPDTGAVDDDDPALFAMDTRPEDYYDLGRNRLSGY